MIDPPATSETDEPDEGFRDLLARPLSDDEFMMLEAIWKLAFSPQFVPAGTAGGWQTWDYVWRMIVRGNSDYPDPEEVLDELPSVPVPNTAGRSYGLVWRMTADSDSPRRDLVGLTIAGALRLSERLPEMRSYADTLARLIASIARASRELEPRRGSSAQGRRPLDAFGAYVDVLSRLERPAETDVVPTAAIGQLIQREYAPVVVNLDNGEWTADLAWSRAGTFASLENAAAYVGKIASDTRRLATPVEAASPLTLIQTLDYFSYVIGAHPAWPKHLRLVSAPDLQSAAMMGLPVITQADFERAVAALWNVIGQLQLPPDLQGTSGGSGSIAKLQSWLEMHVQNPLPLDVTDALAQIRTVGRMRAGFAHNSASTRAAANQAKIRLGIPVFTADWDRAWRVTQGQLALAFETIRHAVQEAEFGALEI